MSSGKVYWLTGLSGAGKTTLCRKLVAYLREQGLSVVMLDGDELREVMGETLAHSREERLQLAMRYARLCRVIANQGLTVAIATISLFWEVHKWNRDNLTNYVEIFLDIPLSELTRRDPKKIYERAAKGELKNVAGQDFAIEAPQAPDVHIKWISEMTVESTLTQLIAELNL